MTASEYSKNIRNRSGISKDAARIIERKGICSDDELRKQIDDQSILKNFGIGVAAFMKLKKTVKAHQHLFQLAELIVTGFIPWKNDFRKIPCIYALYLEGSLQYIGSTDNLLSRIGQHIHEGTKKFDDVRFFELPDFCYKTPAKRFQIEYTVISKLKPPLNGKGLSKFSTACKKYG